jgi:hypothetical protein
VTCAAAQSTWTKTPLRAVQVPIKLIIPSIRVSMNAGHFPATDGWGHVFLKVPVHKLQMRLYFFINSSN